jgi:cobalt transport protein ATP-binding subunit
MTHHSIEVEHLTFHYPDGHLALEEVSLSVAPNEKVALVGPNGSGKSTLLLHLNGVFRSPTGFIKVGGLPLTDDNLGQIRAWVGLVFQNPDDQLFSLYVHEDVAFGPLHMGASDVQARVERALAAVGMSSYANRLSHHLSLGEKKRIAIATVLSMDTKILVLDEPSAGLDPRGRRDLIHLLKGLEQQTMLISTHDMRLAYELCSQVVVLNGGRVAASGTTDEILLNAALMEANGLETPF